MSGLYASRAAGSRDAPSSGARDLRQLAGQGLLAAVAATAAPALLRSLTSAAYDIVWPIVFSRLTRRFEQSRGHTACASGVERLAPECLDRFHDDVEAVVDDLLSHADQPVPDIEAWIADRLTATIVARHRRLRGRRGALQRPRLPQWLAVELGHDRWLLTLAIDVLVWVGVGSTAGNELWPLERWAQKRGALTSDWAGSDPATVAREVETVLAAMRKRPEWYQSYVERPLGAKQAPVAAAPRNGEAEHPPLSLVSAAEADDLFLLELAATAIDTIDAAIRAGEEPRAAIARVIGVVFGGQGLIGEQGWAGDSRFSLEERATRLSEVLQVVGSSSARGPAGPHPGAGPEPPVASGGSGSDPGGPPDQPGGPPPSEPGGPPGPAPDPDPHHFLVGRMPAQVRDGDETSLIVHVAVRAPSGTDSLSTPMRPWPIPAEGSTVTIVVHAQAGLVPLDRVSVGVVEFQHHSLYGCG